MSELIAGAAPQPMHAQELAQWRFRVPTILLAVGLTACSGSSGHKNAGAEGSPSPSASAETVAANVCGEVDLSANYANTHYGSPESMFPALASHDSKSSNEKPFSAEKVSDLLRTQVTHDRGVLAVAYAFLIDTRNTQQLPNTGTLDRAKKFFKEFETNKAAALDALTQACTALDASFLKYTDSFAVTRGQAMAEETVRNDDKAVVGYKSATINTTENLKGWMLDYNHDDASLSEVQKAIFDKLSGLILITNDGKLVINETFGPNSFKLSDVHVQTPVDIKLHGHRTITVSPTPGTNELPGSQNQNNNGGSNANNNSSNSPEKGKSGGSCNGCGQQNCPNCHKGGGGGSTPTPGPGPSGPSGGKTPTPGPTPTQPGGGKTPSPTPSPTRTPNSPSPSPSPSPTKSNDPGIGD